MSLKQGLLLAVLFGLLCVLFHMLHVKLVGIDVLLYAVLIDVFLAWTAVSLILIVTSRSSIVTILYSVILLEAGVIIAVLGPTVIDRSLTLYLLAETYNRGGEVDIELWHKEFLVEYLENEQVAATRLLEQEKSGTIILKGDSVLLTSRGRTIVETTSWYRNAIANPELASE